MQKITFPKPADASKKPQFSNTPLNPFNVKKFGKAHKLTDIARSRD